MFIDKVKITLKAGNGGDGIVSFLRMKGVEFGGPDGGDGGDGGDIVFEGDNSKTSLLDFHYQTKFNSENGGSGAPKLCKGKCAPALILKVPLGTVIKDVQAERIICDVYYDKQQITVLKGGRGGKGNAKFSSSKRRAPHFCQKGETTEPKSLVLELKTIADVGLCGFPNVGKSTFLSKISAAKPKIANYHFTTLSPNLGVVNYHGSTFVAADIPGLIEGASQGQGLGIEFLKHIERTRMLVHIIDMSGIEGREPYSDYKIIKNELECYSEKLAELPFLVAANKMDIPGAEENLKKFKKQTKNKLKIFEISAISGAGTEELLREIVSILKTLPPPEPLAYEHYEFKEENDDSFEIVKEDEGVYAVYGNIVKTMIRNVVLSDNDSMMYFQKYIKDKGVIKALRKNGAKDGDTVIFGDIEFEFVD